MSTGHILLITGWGGGIAPLIPLQSALQQQGYSVQLLDIFDPLSLKSDIYDAALSTHLIVGWSLGGQLATLLAAEVYRNTGSAPRVLTLASNPCFVASEIWPYAMPMAQFMSFKNQFEHHQNLTLKQFYFNICQGEPELKSAITQLRKNVQVISSTCLNMGLYLLETLNTLNELKLPIMSHHVFANDDALIPSQVEERLKQVVNSSYLSTQVISNASHTFPLFHIERTVKEIECFLAKPSLF